MSGANTDAHEPVAPAEADGRLSRWDTHKAERRAHIINCAIEEIAARGPDVTVADIAGRANLTRAVVYRMFDSPEHLHQEIQTAIAAQLFDDLAASFTTVDTELADAVARVVHSYIDLAAAQPRLYRYLGSTSPHSGATTINASRRDTAHIIAARIRSFSAHHHLAVLGHEDQLGYAVTVIVDSTVAYWIRQPAPEREARTHLEARLGRWVTALIASELNAATPADLDPRP